MRSLFLLLFTVFVFTGCENFEDDYLAAQEQIEVLESQLEAVLAQSKKDAETIDNLDSEVTTLEGQLNTLTEALNASEEVSDELREEISALETRIAELEAELAAAHDEIDLLKSDIESLNAQLDAGQINAAEYAEQIAELEEELADAEAHVAELEDEVEEVVEQVQEVVEVPNTPANNTPVENSPADSNVATPTFDLKVSYGSDSATNAIEEDTTGTVTLTVSIPSDKKLAEHYHISFNGTDVSTEIPFNSYNGGLSYGIQVDDKTDSVLITLTGKDMDKDITVVVSDLFVDKVAAVSCNATEFEAIDVTFDENDYLVMPGSDYSVGTVAYTQTVTKTVCTDGVASEESAVYKIEVITSKLGSNTESGWGFDESQNDDDDLIDNVDKVQIKLKYYVDGVEDEDLETSADWFVVVIDNTPVVEVETFDLTIKYGSQSNTEEIDEDTNGTSTIEVAIPAGKQFTSHYHISYNGTNVSTELSYDAYNGGLSYGIQVDKKSDKAVITLTGKSMDKDITVVVSDLFEDVPVVADQVNVGFEIDVNSVWDSEADYDIDEDGDQSHTFVLENAFDRVGEDTTATITYAVDGTVYSAGTINILNEEGAKVIINPNAGADKISVTVTPDQDAETLTFLIEVEDVDDDILVSLSI